MFKYACSEMCHTATRQADSYSCSHSTIHTEHIFNPKMRAGIVLNQISNCKQLCPAHVRRLIKHAARQMFAVTLYCPKIGYVVRLEP